MENRESSESVFIADKADRPYSCQHREDIVRAVIPDGIASIGEFAFCGCVNLESVTIPDSVTSIGSAAFVECVSLKSITIPDSVSSLGDFVFIACSSLESIAVPEGVTSAGCEAFQGCESLKSVRLPESVITVGYEAFDKCGSLKHIELPAGIRFINKHAFRDSGLESIVIPDGIAAVHSEAFAECKALKSIVWRGRVYDSPEALIKDVSEASLGFIAERADETEVYRYSGLRRVIIPEGIKKIAASAFENSELESIIIPDSVVHVENSAFADCGRLKHIELPDGIAAVHRDAFKGCRDLKITWRGEVYDGAEAFNEAFSELSVDFTADRAGEEGAYRGCGFRKVTIPEGITQIAAFAFAQSSLESITIPDSVISIGECAFANCFFKYILFRGRRYTERDAFNQAVKDSGVSTSEVWITADE